MGGSISCQSKKGVGTTFTVSLPLAHAVDEKKQKAEETGEGEVEEDASESYDFGGRRILLAEDNELNAEIAETVLEETGIKVKHVEDGIQCIEELKKMPEKYYDVILMDVQMPNMDGYTATQRIRDLDDSRAEIPIIAMTANAYDEDRRKAQEAGMDGFLAKPLDVDEMMRLLAQIIKTE